MKITSQNKMYHKAAATFIKKYSENSGTDNVRFNYALQHRIAEEAILIAKSIPLKKMSYQNSIVASWFRFVDTMDDEVILKKKIDELLIIFFCESNYPKEDREIVKLAIATDLQDNYAETKVQKVVCDAMNSRLAWPSLLEDIIIFKDEMNRVSEKEGDEVFFLNYYYTLFLKKRYFTKYANEKFSLEREKNFEKLEKKIHKLQTVQKTELKNAETSLVISGKETEDLFKIAFRNYNHLVSVADSKAALLINVNSIIISVVLGLVLSKIEKNIFLLLPTIILLSICLITIFLSVMASRPQHNSFSEYKKSHSYQKFFFGSFDLIDNSFRSASWEQYYNQLLELFTNSKEKVYMELFKESYNVRKVLSKKFNYLSFAYWVFMIGLIVSIVIFIMSIKNQTFVT